MENNKRILIVDDQKDLCEQLSKLLLRAGKANETLSLVQQMRAKLLGAKAEKEPEDERDAENHYEVEVAHRGEEAVAKIAKSLDDGNPFALIFLDMRMPPGWDGLQTAKKIRELDKNVELVIMTAFADHDQKQIADEVGHPHKLLYIKKPFQAEEIFQLALSLTAKWNLEHAEIRRKKWLEAIIKGLCKLKNPSITQNTDGAFSSTLKAFLELMESEKGMIAVFNSIENRWALKCFNGLLDNDAADFISENRDALKECRTTKHEHGRYVLPMRKNDFFAVVAIFDVQMKNDPEWYKLLSILSMTATDVLSASVDTRQDIENEKFASAGKALSKLSRTSIALLNSMEPHCNILKEHCADKVNAEAAQKITAIAEEMRTGFENLLLYEEESRPFLEKINLLSAIKEGIDSVIGGKNVSLKTDCGQNIEVMADRAMMKTAFANLALNSIKYSNKEKTEIRIIASVVNEKIKIIFEDDGGGISEGAAEDIFSPFKSNSSAGGLGLGLPIVKQIILKHLGRIKYDQTHANGVRFVIELPIPSIPTKLKQS